MIEAIADDAATIPLGDDIAAARAALADAKVISQRGSDRALKVAADARRKSSPSLPQVKP